MTSLTASFIPKYGNALAMGINIFGDAVGGTFTLFGKITGKAIGAIGGLLGGLISTIGKLASAPGNMLAVNSTVSTLASLGGLLWMGGNFAKGDFGQGLGDVFKGGFSLDKLIDLPIDSLLDTTSMMGGALSMIPGMEGTGLSMMIVPQIIKAIKNNFDGIKKFFDEQLKKFFGDTDDQWKTRKEEWSKTFNEFYTNAGTIWNGVKDIFELLLNFNNEKQIPEINLESSHSNNTQKINTFEEKKNDFKTFLVDNGFISKENNELDSLDEEDYKLISNNAESRKSLVDDLLKMYESGNNKNGEVYRKQIEEKLDTFKTTNKFDIKEKEQTNPWKMNAPEEGNFKLKEGELPFTNPGAGTHLDKLNPEFYSRFLAAATEYYNKTGKKLSISDGWRSYDEQVRLKKEKPGLAATPGNSMHGYGMAMDIDSNHANTMAKMGILDKFGITRPMLAKKAGEKYEPWHIEPAGLDKNGLKSTGKSGLKSGSEYSQFLGKSSLSTQEYKASEKNSTNIKSQSMLESTFGMGSKMFDILTSDESIKSFLGQMNKDITPTSQEVEEYERKMNLPKSNNGFNNALDKFSKPLIDGITSQLKNIHGGLTSINQTVIKQDSTKDNVVKLDHQESMIMLTANILTV